MPLACHPDDRRDLIVASECIVRQIVKLAAFVLGGRTFLFMAAC